MASTITNYSNSINVNFPVLGADNDTQGFRTNFANIQNAFEIASREISNIQLSAVSLGSTNDFGDNIIRRASFQDTSILLEDIAGSQNGSLVLDYTEGSYQKFTVASSATLSISIINWPPAGQCGTIRVDMRPATTASFTVNFSDADYVADGLSLPATYVTQSRPVVWELWSPDSGTTVFAKKLIS